MSAKADQFELPGQLGRKGSVLANMSLTRWSRFATTIAFSVAAMWRVPTSRSVLAD